jgi:hypothetical protein
MKEYCVQVRKPGGEWTVVGDYTYTTRDQAYEAYYRLTSEQNGEFFDDVRVSSVREAQRLIDRYVDVKDLTYRVAVSEPRVWRDADEDWG